MIMHIAECSDSGLGFVHKRAFKSFTAPLKGTVKFAKATNPFSFGSRLLTRLQKTAEDVVAGKQLYDQTRYAFRGGSPQTPSVKPTPSANDYGVRTGASVNVATGQRLVPGTTQIQLPRQTLSRSDIRFIQTQLRNRGFDAGPLDGIYGPKTKAGIEAYQAAAGVVVNGIPTGNLVNALRVAPVKAATAPLQPTIYQPSPASIPPYSAPAPALPPVAKAGLPDWAMPAGVATGAVVLALLVSKMGK